MIITTALASLASAVFLYQVMQPTSFLSAVRGVEISGISRETWDEIYEQLRSRLREKPIARNHEAVAHLLNVLIQVERGSKSAADVLPGAQVALEADGNNLVSRLAYAVLADSQAGAADAKRLPLERFEAMRQVMERQPPASTATLYNDEYTHVWHDVLKKYIHRADVAASAATSLDHFQIVDHYAALPMIQQRITSLAGELRANGNAAEAEACTRWIGRTMLRLIDSEKDAGTQLLAVQLLGRTVDSRSDISNQLRAMHDQFHHEAASALPDLSDFTRMPVVANTIFRKTLERFIEASSAFLVGMGGLLGCLCAGAIGTWQTLRRHSAFLDGALSVSIRKRAVLFCVLGLVISAGTGDILADGLFSTQCLLELAMTVAGIGAIAATFAVGRDSAQPTRALLLRLLSFVPLGLLYLLVVSFSGWFSMRLRAVDIAVGGVILVFIVVLISIIFTMGVSRLGRRTLAFNAALVWLVNSALAVGFLQLHRAADSRYQDIISTAHFDEVAARLGPDWQDAYLKSARAAYDMKQP